MADAPKTPDRNRTTTPTRRDVASPAARPSERERLLERARREVPGLREQVAANLNDLRRIAGQN